jgi:hypothetical protein
MIYRDFKHLVEALLIGDTTLTKNDDEILVLLRYAYERIANEADAMKLFTTESPNERIVRNGPGGLYVRMPSVPEYEEDELDIDEELCFAAARFVCSFVSMQKVELHIMEASKIINSYNQKVQTFFETLEAQNKFPDTEDRQDSYFGSRIYS